MHGCEGCSEYLRRVADHYRGEVEHDGADELALNASALGIALADFFEGDRRQVVLAFSSALTEVGLTAKARFVNDDWLASS
jgi:hypothetical protein